MADGVRRTATVKAMLTAEREIITTIWLEPGAFARFEERGLSEASFENEASRHMFRVLREHFTQTKTPPTESVLRLRMGDRAGWLDEFCVPNSVLTFRAETEVWSEFCAQRSRRASERTARLAAVAADNLDIDTAVSLLGDAKELLAEAESGTVPHVASPVGLVPADILVRWSGEGALVRLETGIEALDRLCRGGFPIPWRVFVVGAPSAGKTAFQVVIADRIARALGAAGACVGLLAVDEDPDDLLVRILQIAGFSVADAETRDPMVLAKMDEALKAVRVRLYDARFTIETAAADLSTWARSVGRHAVLCVDSLQAVRSDSSAVKTARELVEANVAAIRRVSTDQHLLVIATSEANRAAYRNDAAADQNDLAAGAESRAIEFGAQTQLVLRTPRGHPDVVHVRVAKNRRAHVGEFWLRLDRENHSLTECADPTKDGSSARIADEVKAERTRAGVENDARKLASVVARNSGLSERRLRAAVKMAGCTWGVNRMDAAEARLAQGVDGFRLSNAGTSERCKWVLESVSDEETGP